MATSTELQSSNRNVNRQILDQEILVKAYIDTSAINLTSGDYYKLFDYDANTFINEVVVITETVEGAADTLDITDDSAGTTTLVSNHDVNTDNAITKYTTGLFKNTAGQISIKPDAALATCKFWVIAKLVIFNGGGVPLPYPIKGR
jgi:hypothetical protein